MLVADVLNNVSAFARCPVQKWNDSGLYRLLFRCTSWPSAAEATSTARRVRAGACRALRAAAPHKCVRASLAATKDCLHNLMITLTPLGEDDIEGSYLLARTEALRLLGWLLSERAAGDTVWRYLVDSQSLALFHLLLQCLESDEIEFQDAGLYCLTQLAQSSMHKKHEDKTKDVSCVEFYDNLKSPFINRGSSDSFSAGDSARDFDCQPEYMAEELCKALINLYQKVSLESQNYQSSPESRWCRVCSCLASVLSASARSRRYGAHRRLPRLLLHTLQAVRDRLCLQGVPADVIRTANYNPILRTLYWTLTVIDCSMVECPPAKDSFAEDNMAVSLNRLWPWCMMTDQLRHAVMHLLYTFTNDCPKAWGAMCSCVGGRCLVGEVCALCGREAALQSRPHPDALLLLALHTLRRCLHHHHCRAVVLKSDMMSSMCKLCMRERGRGARGAGAAWARVCAALARHGDGAAALLAQCAPAALPPPLRARLMPALAHAAHHHRVTFLQSPGLLELLSGTLLAGDTAEIVSAARAVWALAANNHKAKLLLRSAGVAAAVHSALQRVQRGPGAGAAEPASRRTLQLLTYTNTVLQAT